MKTKLPLLTEFLYEVGTLRKLARSHRQTLLTDDLSDNIASHSFRVAVIGWFLAKIEKADPYKVLMMCLFHDTSESRSGDQNWVHKKYVKVFEEEIITDQFSPLPFSEELLSISHEYQKRLSKEAKLAKDADLIDQVLLLREHQWAGNNEAGVWLKGEEQIKRVTSKTAKNLLKEIYGQRPSSWWSDLWTSERK